MLTWRKKTSSSLYRSHWRYLGKMQSLRNCNLPCQSNPSRVFLENSISQKSEEIPLLEPSDFHSWYDAISSILGCMLSPEGREDSGAAASHHPFQGKPNQRRTCWCWKPIFTCTDPKKLWISHSLPFSVSFPIPRPSAFSRETQVFCNDGKTA